MCCWIRTLIQRDFNLILSAQTLFPNRSQVWGVRTLTCLFRVHSSVPAGPVSHPSCTCPRLVWYWTFPSGSPPVFSTTSTCPPPCLSPVIFNFSLHWILSVSSKHAHASLIFIPALLHHPTFPFLSTSFSKASPKHSVCSVSSSPSASSSGPFCWASALIFQRALPLGPSSHIVPVVLSHGEAVCPLSFFFFNFVYFGCAGSPLLRECSLS